jgi:large subunit ribosomal protein L35
MKMKTKKAAAKRFKLTATGKVKFKHAGVRHKMMSKSRKRKRKAKALGVLGPWDFGHIERMLPFGTR